METYNLFDIANPKQWKTISSENFDANGKYNVYGANGIIGKTNTYNHKEETVLITCRGATCGTVNLSEPFSYINGNAMALDDLDKSKAVTKYVYYFFQNYDFQNVITGSAQPQITRESLKKVRIPLPDIETQNKIVTILDKAKTILDKREETIKKYDELLRATFLEIFGDPVLNTKKWSVQLFEKVTKNENLKRIPIKESDRDNREGQYPYYGATGIIDFIDDYKYDGNYLLIAEDGKNLLFNRKDNAFLASGKFWVNNHAHVLSDNGVCTIYYLLYFLNLIDLKPYITGIDQIKLNKTNLEKIPVPVPPRELQEKFGSVYHKYDNLKQKLIDCERLISELNVALSQLAFKGELDFNTAVDLEVLLENDYAFFKENSNTNSIKLLLERLDKDELNANKFYEQQAYNKAKSFVFELLKEGKIQQVFDEDTKKVKLTA
jgi:type I restriction enzyme, S subunit